MLSSEGLSEALVQEVASLGIHVTIVEPGEFRTDFAGRSLVRAHREIAGYAQKSGATRKQLPQVNGHQAGDPRRAAQAMIQFVDTARPPLRFVLAEDALSRMRGKRPSYAH